jgi:hypothetical protein
VVVGTVDATAAAVVGASELAVVVDGAGSGKGRLIGPVVGVGARGIVVVATVVWTTAVVFVVAVLVVGVLVVVVEDEDKPPPQAPRTRTRRMLAAAMRRGISGPSRGTVRRRR